MLETMEAVMARVMQRSAIRTGTVADMDREELRREMNRLGFVKLHYFGDGRKVFVKQSSEFSRPCFVIGVQNLNTNFAWSEYPMYYELEKAVSTAEGLFGITEWNAV